MKQRVNVASTLLSNPQVIILDEPSTGLDPRGMSEVRDIVKSLGNRLVFMSSHLLSEVTEVCQEVAMIDHGKLLVYDTIGNVTSKFSGKGGAAEIGFSRDVDDATLLKVSRLEGLEKYEKTDARHVNIKFTGGLQAQERLFGQLSELKVGVVSFRESSTGLEDAYLALIKDTL
jgi:ABC-2 type transport system ATP-binding protein